MEKPWGPSPETGAADNHDKSPGAKDRRRVRLSRAVIGEASTPPVSPAETASERPKNTLRLDKAFIKLVVKEKLQNDKPYRQEPEPEVSGHPENEVPAEVAAPDTEAQTEQLLQSAEANANEEQQQDDAEEASYETLQERYDSLGANEFIGDVVVSLHDPVREHVTPVTGNREETVELSEATPVATEPSPRTVQAVEQPQLPPFGENEGISVAVASSGELPTQSQEAPNTGYAEPSRHIIGDETPSAIQREYIYESGYSATAETTTPRNSSNEDGVTKAELNDTIYRATKAGQNKGVVTGLLVGAGYEHFKHKKIEKKNEKRYEAQAKQTKKDQQANRIHAEEQDRRRNELEDRLYATERRLGDAETYVQKQQPEQMRAEKQPVAIPKQPQVEQLQVPAEHRVESSAWLRTEVDKRTGKPVENPTFAYGEEYHKERAQENKQAGQPHGGSAAAPAVAGNGSASHSSGVPGSSSSLPPVGLPSATTQGPPSQNRPLAETKASSKPKVATGQTVGPIWPWLVALLAIVVSLALILH